MNWNKIIAGVFAGSGALYLLYLGYITEGGMILSGMMGFFVGDANGRKAKQVEV